MEASMQANAPMRSIQVSTDTFAAIWVDRRAGENSEDAILRRKFNVEVAQTDVHAPSSAHRPSPSVGFYDRRYALAFPEGFEIFRHFKGSDYSAKATSGA